MINENETPIPSVEEYPLDAKLVSADPIVGQEFQTTITVDDIDPSSSSNASGPIGSTEQQQGNMQQQNNSEQPAGGIAGAFAPVMNFFRNSSAAATLSERLSNPPQGIRSMQSWDKFIGDKTKYSLPGIHYIWPRLQSNFTQFKYNYLAITVILLIILA